MNEFLEKLLNKRYSFAWKLGNSFQYFEEGKLSKEKIAKIQKTIKKIEEEINKYDIEWLLKQKKKEVLLDKWEENINKLFEIYLEEIKSLS